MEHGDAQAMRHARRQPQQTQELREGAPSCTPEASEGNPFHHQAFDKTTRVLRDRVLDAVTQVTVFRVPGCRALWRHGADNPRLLWTSVLMRSDCGQQEHGIVWRA